MRRDPDAEDSNIDGCNHSHSPPFDTPYRLSVLSYKSDTIDDNLHKQLDFKNPAKEDEEEDRDTAYVRLIACLHVWV